MAKFTVYGGPTALEQHNQKWQAYKMRQAFIDGAKNSRDRNGRTAMNGNFFNAPTNMTTGSRIYEENIARIHPTLARAEIGRAFTAGQETGGRLYGSDLGWAAAEYAQNRMIELKTPRKTKKKEDNSVYDSALKFKPTTPGQDNTVSPTSAQAPTPATTSNSTASTEAANAAGNDSKDSQKAANTTKTQDAVDPRRKAADNLASDNNTSYNSLTKVTLDPKESTEKYGWHFKSNAKGFDHYAKADLGIEKDGAKTANDLIRSSGVSEEQSATLTSVIDNWDNDAFISDIPPTVLSFAISSLKAKIRSGSHSERDFKILAALEKRIMKITGDTAVTKAGTSVANVLN